jgi:hypothetical protein
MLLLFCIIIVPDQQTNVKRNDETRMTFQIQGTLHQGKLDSFVSQTNQQTREKRSDETRMMLGVQGKWKVTRLNKPASIKPIDFV